jgi:DNA-directed RNA polymerase specialized sigma24 family protein
MEVIIQDHFKKHYDKLVSKSANVLGDWHYGEDCVQESYENALKYHHSFDGSNFDTWFYTIYINMLRKYIKFVKSQGINQEIKVAHHPLFPSEIKDCHLGLIASEIEKSNKTDAVKNLLYCYFILGYRGKELEAFTGLTEGAIHTQANRFKQLLMEKYDVFKKS